MSLTATLYLFAGGVFVLAIVIFLIDGYRLTCHDIDKDNSLQDHL